MHRSAGPNPIRPFYKDRQYFGVLTAGLGFVGFGRAGDGLDASGKWKMGNGEWG
jgi:hypothetical protein